MNIFKSCPLPCFCLEIKQLFNGCGCNRPSYLSYGAGNDQVFYCICRWPRAIEHLVIPSTSGQIVRSIASTPIK